MRRSSPIRNTVLISSVLALAVGHAQGQTYTTIWSDGFNGSLGNWTVDSTYTYSTGASHGSYTGAGAAYAGTAASRMYRSLGSRPFAACRTSGWFYDALGGWKAGSCGAQYRQTLRLTPLDGSANMFIEHGFYSTPGYGTYNYRTVGSGAIAWSSYGNRNTSTGCSAAWIYFETVVSPGAPGASPVGTFTIKATDGGGTPTTTQNLTTDFFSYGVGRVYLGMNLSSTTYNHYWDDIKFEAVTPGAPTSVTGTADSTSQMTWSWARADNYHFGFDVLDGSNNAIAPQYPNSGWLGRSTTQYVESGLTANQACTRKVRAWNGTLNGDTSLTRNTLANNPSYGTGTSTPTVTSDKGSGNYGVGINSNITFTATNGFGNGAAKVGKFGYLWDQNAGDPSSWSGEQAWSSGTLAVSPTATGSWYLHLRSYNNSPTPVVSSGVLNIGPFIGLPTPTAGTNSVGQHQVDWQWTLSGSGHTGLRVYSASSGGTALTEIADPAATHWLETGLTLNTTYNRWVCTYYADGGEGTRVQLNSAFTGFQQTFHGSTTNQNIPSDDIGLYEGCPDSVIGSGAGLTLECGYADGFTGDCGQIPQRRRSIIKWNGMPAKSLCLNNSTSARLTMQCVGRYSTTAYDIAVYSLSSGNWTETNATWNTMAGNFGSALATASIADTGVYSNAWQWNASTATLANGIGIFNASGETTKTYAKNFASQSFADATPPQIQVDYYLPDVTDQWITDLLILGPVGSNDIDDETYLSGSGFSSDTDVYGSSIHTISSLSWVSYTGDTTDDEFDNYGWDLRQSPHEFGEYACALFNLYVHSSASASHCYLRLGSDDGVRCIVNDTIVGTDDASRGWGREQSVFGPFNVNAGWNRVLIKVRNGVSGFGLKAVRFSNADATNWSGSTLTFATDDTTAPSHPTGCTESGGAGNDTWQSAVADPNFTWSGATDTAGSGEGASGVRGYYYYWGSDSNGTSTNFTTSAAYDPAAPGSGTYYLRIKTVDRALNESAWQTLFTFKYDGIPPLSSCDTTVTCTSSALTDIAWTASDGSGVGTVELWYKKEAAGTWSNTGIAGSGESGTFGSWTPPAGDGTYYIRSRASDALTPANVETDLPADGDDSFVYDASPPTITEITAVPASAEVCPGEQVDLSVTATGQCNVGYQWQSDIGGWHDLVGQTASSLSLTDIAEADQGNYRCEVSDDGGSSTSDSVAVIVNDTLVIAGANPRSLYVSVNSACANAGNQLELSATDADGDANAILWTILTSPSHGSATLLDDSGATALVCYQPTSGYQGTDGFVIQATDEFGCFDTLTINTNTSNAPQISHWYSAATHTNVGEILLELDPSRTGTGLTAPMVEPRLGGIRKIVVDFTETVVPNNMTMGTGWQVVQDSLGSTYTTTSTVFDPNESSGDRLNLLFDANVLSDGKRYTINLAGKFKSASTGLGVAGTTSCQVRALMGSSANNGTVGLGDIAAIRGFNRAAVSNDTGQYDLNTDGGINLIDMVLARSVVGHSVP